MINQRGILKYECKCILIVQILEFKGQEILLSFLIFAIIEGSVAESSRAHKLCNCDCAIFTFYGMHFSKIANKIKRKFKSVFAQ